MILKSGINIAAQLSWDGLISSISFQRGVSLGLNPTSQKIRLAIAGNRRLIRELISTAIVGETAIEIVVEEQELQLAIDVARDHRPDVIILDIAQTAFEPFDFIPQITHACPRTRILVLVSNLIDDDIFELVKAGARGYISTQNAGTADLLNAIRALYAGEFWIERSITAKLLDFGLNKDNNDLTVETKPILSKRELDVIGHLAKGLSNKEIAAALYISEKTVKNHLSSVYAKLDVHNRLQLINRILALSDQIRSS